MDKDRKAAANSTFAIGGVSCFADSFVDKKVQFYASTFVLKSPPSQICKTFVIGYAKTTP